MKSSLYKASKPVAAEDFLAQIAAFHRVREIGLSSIVEQCSKDELHREFQQPGSRFRCLSHGLVHSLMKASCMSQIWAREPNLLLFDVDDMHWPSPGLFNFGMLYRVRIIYNY